jgi:hypothetical protein
MQEQPLEREAEIQGPLELGGAPRHAEIMADEEIAAAIDDDMGDREGVRATEALEIVDLNRGNKTCH